MKVSKGLFLVVLICGLILGMNPMTAKAVATTNITTVKGNCLSVNTDTLVNIAIPAELVLNNVNNASTTITAYRPAFDAYIVATPLTDATDPHHPYDFATGNFPGSGAYFYGNFNLSASDTETFTDGKINFAAASFGYCPEWFVSTPTGGYRYQIQFVDDDDTDNDFGAMFTLPNMTTDTQRLFIDFYIENNEENNAGTVKAVVLVDDQDRKWVSSATSSTTDSVINSLAASQPLARISIKYNVCDVKISNSILGSRRNSPFHYNVEWGTNEKGGAINYFTDTQDNATGTFASDTKIISIVDKYGRFEYTVYNYPLGLEMTVTQTSPVNTAGQLEVYVAAATRYTDQVVDTIWDAVPSGYTNAEAKTITVSDSECSVSFVNLAHQELPPTGITTTAIPFLIMLGLAAGLYIFNVKKGIQKRDR